MNDSTPLSMIYNGDFLVKISYSTEDQLSEQFSCYSTQLKSNDIKEKMEAAEALSFIDSPLCIDYVIPMLSIENLEVLGINTLSRFNIDKVRKLIMGMLSHNESEVVSAAINALDSMKVQIPRIKFLDMLSSNNASIRFIGLENLELTPNVNDKNYIIPLFQDLDSIVAKKAKEYNQLISK